MNRKKALSPSQQMERNAAAAEALLKQLANAKRLMILCTLLAERKSVGELAEILALSPSALSQHLAGMREAGLIGADRRGRQVYYHVTSMEAQALLSTLYLIYCRG